MDDRFKVTPEQVREAVERRIWPRCEVSGECWLWTGANNVYGYGRVIIGGRTVGTHRAVLMNKLGRPLAPNMMALHSCDARACCNPDHLREGTHLENMADKRERDRHPKGARHYRAKLGEGQVREIRNRYAAGGVTQQALADAYGLSRPSVTEIISGKRYAEVTSHA